MPLILNVLAHVHRIARRILQYSACQPFERHHTLTSANMNPKCFRRVTDDEWAYVRFKYIRMNHNTSPGRRRLAKSAWTVYELLC